VQNTKKRGIFSDIFHFLTSNVFAAIIGIISSIIITRILGPQNKGILTSALVLPNIIIGFSFLGIRQSVVVNVGGKKYTDNQIISSLFYLSLFTSIIGIALCSIFFFSGTYYTKDLSVYIIILILCLIPFRIANNYLNSFYLGKSHFKIINTIRWLNASFYLFIILITVYLLKFGITGVFTALFLTALITFLILISLLFHHHYFILSGGGLKFNKAIINQIVSLGILYALAFVIITLNLRSDVLLLKYFKGNESVGFYSIAVAIAESIWQISMAVGTVIISRTANSDDAGRIVKDTNMIIRITVVLAIFIGTIILFVSPYLIPLIYGALFAPSIPIVQIIIPGILFFAIMRILISFIAGKGKPWVIIMIGAPALLTNILINLYTIPLWGGMGAAIATDISYFIAFVFTLSYYIRKNNVSLSDILLLKKEDILTFRNFVKGKFHKH
jgi:O-antigen/teichoic acid export membrane protein